MRTKGKCKYPKCEILPKRNLGAHKKTSVNSKEKIHKRIKSIVSVDYKGLNSQKFGHKFKKRTKYIVSVDYKGLSPQKRRLCVGANPGKGLL
jgi:hypothetical protein